MPVLVDTNVILDMVNEDPVWLDWSRAALESLASGGFLTNAMVYAELCCCAESAEEVDALVTAMDLKWSEIPRRALFDASRAHLVYRRRGGTRTSGLPDFFIGAHADALGVAILTRDPGRYRTYFPRVPLVCP
ncbi:MAG: type II toxin-antitoxin system VapC family toxin [Lentisphaerae bacterium]|jgi:predicted nucleic acid-binding protein|nr:type II toxin-antitoxin system VapC family toxin [Lentisphaerota bacterium]MBT4817805.1 type II toxin-antitoxin system VapC family toxin [Lentisphaerota bacterium]MBT5612132.1 type II toxin-antitoxin system VapC family toxin [Lentisphaerota bacterium]MBT7058769.1 type II toxin-antitoxin system VapC family toxin [Lentisphaerota bacterium]